jgi:hypothetical protein
MSKPDPPLAPTRKRRQEFAISIHTRWTNEEDQLLRHLMSLRPAASWCHLLHFFPNKTAAQISGRWDKVLNPNLVKGSWTRDEDEAIVQYVSVHGPKNWAHLALQLPNRTGKQCRERWKNHLDANLTAATEWTADEDARLIELHRQFGNQWVQIAPFFQGRTDNSIKNRWNSTLKKRLARIESGEPLVRKRGPKPKTVLMPYMGDEIGHDERVTPNSSPLHPLRTLLDTMTVHTSLASAGDSAKGTGATLEDNRKHLEMLLSNLA